MILTLSDPVDVSLSTTGAWTDIDLTGISGYTSAVTGCVVKFMTTASSNRNFGVRKKGSTDNRTGLIIGQPNGTQAHAYIGVDTSGFIQGYISDVDMDFYVVALITEDVFFTNAVDKSTTTTSSWVDLDISSDTGGDTATHAWFEWSTPALVIGAFRKNGSTDDRRAQTVGTHGWAGVGVDGSELCEQWINNTLQVHYLVGYGTTSMTWHTNAIDRSTATTGSYQTVASPDASAVAAIYDFYTTGSTAYRHALRRTGSSVDQYQCLYLRNYPTVTLSAKGGTAEQKIQDVAVDLYELGYWVESGGGPRVNGGATAGHRRNRLAA